MKSRVLKKLFLFLALLLTFHFLLFTRSSFADYPTLLKNGFIEEVDSSGDQGEVNQIVNGTEKKPLSSKKGFHILLAPFGVSKGIDKDKRQEGFISRIFFGYWFNDRLGLGLEGGRNQVFCYNVDGFRMIEVDYFISPEIKIGIISRSKLGVFLDLGVGIFWATDPSVYWGPDFPSERRTSFNLGLGFYYRINRFFETGIIIDLKMMDAYLQQSTLYGTEWRPDYGLFYLTSFSPFIGLAF
jgi:hypothetical protein